MRIARILFTLMAASFALAPALSRAEYPDRPVKLVVPYTPGGPADLLGRYVALKLGQSLGQPVVIENKPGAGLAVGAESVIRSAPDGYTLFLGASSMLVDSGGGGRTPAQNLKDLVPISLVGSLPLVLVATNELPVKDVRELIAYAKAHPGQLNYGTSGNGSLTHLGGALFTQMSGARLMAVPYRGINEALVDLTAGRVQLSWAGAPIALPLVKTGKMKALAVTGLARSAFAPELPTVGESGLPGYDVTPWYGVMAPVGTPAPVIDRLHREIVKVMQQPDVKEKWLTWGADATYSKTPAEFAALERSDMAKWAKLVKNGQVKLD